MNEVYTGHGLRFEYPETWQLDESRIDNEVSITVSSPETSFWTLTLFFDKPRPEELIESALDAFRQEYEEVDIYDVEELGEGRLTQDLEFVCFELINSAFLRTFETDRFTALVLYQGTDHELEHAKPQMDAMLASIRFDQVES